MAMTQELRASALTTFEIARDGSSVSMGVRDESGVPAAVHLPVDCLRQLVMTLPRMANLALRAFYKNQSLRLVFPLSHWRLEQAAECRNVILTLQTADGFEASFALSGREADDLSLALAGHDSEHPLALGAAN
jgi:hypothetical protein